MKKFFYYLFKVLTFPLCFIGFLILSLVCAIGALFCFILQNLSNVLESNYEILYNWFSKIFKIDKE